jgi:hypothetical protein
MPRRTMLMVSCTPREMEREGEVMPNQAEGSLAATYLDLLLVHVLGLERGVSLVEYSGRGGDCQADERTRLLTMILLSPV